MSKLFLLSLCLAICQLAFALQVEENTTDSDGDISADGWSVDDVADVGLDAPEDDSKIPEDEEARAWWGAIFNLLKKALKVEGLSCNGASCRSCLSAFGKGACVGITYNRQAGANAAIQVSVTAGSRTLWSGSLNAGRPARSCLRLKFPIKEVCIQNFYVTAGNGGRPEGDLCFTINFKSYSLGVKLCANWRGHGLHASAPQIVKT